MAWYEQRFTAPGTWTKPANVSTVYVTVVGGGGGGAEATIPGPSIVATCGGGGGVRSTSLPVTGPVPVTVGAGGAAGGPTSPGGIGGSSFFGPYEAGGGGGGTAPPSPTSTNSNAPAVGGGGGGRYVAQPIPLGPQQSYLGGTGGLGFPGFNLNGGGMTGVASTNQKTYQPDNGAMFVNGELFGAGGATHNSKSGIGEGIGYQSPYSPVRANAGFGAAGSVAGGSGIVIVRWWE